MSNDSTLTPFSAMPLTMSSLEIAQRTRKEHKNVLADIRKMLAELGLRPADFSADVLDSYGRTQPGYLLPKRECLTLVSGYNTELRAAIIDRWMELEAAPAPFAIPKTMAEALRLAADQQEVIEQQRGQIEADKPKTGFFDRFMNADGLFGLQNAGRILIEPPNKFVGWLKQQFLFYQGGSLVPRAQYRTMGIFEVKATVVEDKARYQTYVTPKGLQYLAKKLGKSIPGLEA
jgi:anti-repressor protein